MTIDQRTGQCIRLMEYSHNYKMSNRVYVSNPVHYSSVLTEPSFLISSV